MPFLKGIMPMRRTLWYLNQGDIYFRNSVRIFALAFAVGKRRDNHLGAKEFQFWHWAQIQYRNPDVQMERLKELTPTPFIRVFLDSGDDYIMDIDGMTRQEIYDRVKYVFGKTPEILAKEALRQQKIENPANFGYDCPRQCMCEVSGQHPCPRLMEAPYYLKGRWRWNHNLIS